MYWIKILDNKSKEESIIEFDSKEDAKLFRDYHIKFDAWNKKESWIAERNLSPLHKKLVVDSKVESRLNSNKELVEIKYFKIVPEFQFLGDNIGALETELFWDKLREERSLVLTNTDWTQIADCSMDSKTRHMYREYRQYLRNLPLNYNDDTVINYTIMSFDRWRDFFKK